MFDKLRLYLKLGRNDFYIKGKCNGFFYVDWD